jgi:Predicted soluble lytic transglycosylase fused to an ABC-type amino acid-binding protein
MAGPVDCSLYIQLSNISLVNLKRGPSGLFLVYAGCCIFHFMKWRRNYSAFLILILSHLIGCVSPAEQSFHQTPIVSIDLAAIKERGYLTAIVDNNSVSYFIYKGRPMGYEYELLQQLTQHLKVDLKIKLTTSIEEAIDQLNTGAGDILAFPLTITKERTNYVSFTNTHFNTYQVLVQKKPTNWRMQPPALVEKKMLRNPSDLIGKEVYVKQGSAFKDRLENLSHEVGGDIHIIEDSVAAETEALIRKVATGEIKYTVADQTIAMVNQLYYPNLDINTVISLPQQIAWAVRTNSPELLKVSNDWLAKVKSNSMFQVIYNKYFNSPRFSLNAASSDYSSLGGNKLSPYDEQLKEGAVELNWDWRLLPRWYIRSRTSTRL